MKKAILGKKLGMSQVFAENGDVVAVTVIEAAPCVVIQTKTKETDGYAAIKVGYGKVKERRVNKPDAGQFKKADVEVKKYFKEFRFEDADKYNVGDELNVSIFEAGEKVDVTGVSKGKGFAGAIKRWGQGRGPMTHGSHYHRSPGSMGSSASPSRVFKGKRLPGHMGHKKITVQNLEIIKVYEDKNIILIKGGLPGAKGTLLTIKEAVKS